MKKTLHVISGALLIGLIALSSACVVGPREGYREGYYDRDHHRYYREHAWHECTEHNEYCR